MHEREGSPMPSPNEIATLAVHGGERHPKPNDAITDAIYCTSTYTFSDSAAILRFLENNEEREEYGRYGNPNERVVERKLASLDGAESALVFCNGMAAIVTLLMSKTSAGDEIIFFDECYHRSREFCQKHLSRFGVTTKVVKTNDYDALQAAVSPKSKLLVSESPTNPHLSVVDVEKFAAIGRLLGVETLIDATLATPFNLQPIAAGIDYVLHSATKYLGGHNDLLAGVVCGATDKLEPIRNLRGIIGTISSPHVCWLLQRGLKSFALRMAQHNANGLALAEFLASRPEVKRVYYPGLKTHPGYDVARRTMRGFGGLLTFSLRGDRHDAMRFVDSVRIPKIGPSLGGVESLIEQPLLMSYWNMTAQQREAVGIEDSMIRVAAGIEDRDELIADFRQAFDALKR
jgi:cystathionine gamma-synthase